MNRKVGMVPRGLPLNWIFVGLADRYVPDRYRAPFQFRYTQRGRL